MNKILIAAGSEKAFSELTYLSKKYINGQIIKAAGGNEARRLINLTEPELVIICTPLHDESGTELAVSTAEKTNAGIILICSRKNADETAHLLEPYGICVIASPIDQDIFSHSVRLLGSARSRMMNIMQEYSRLQNKIEETRIISRAKCILIQYLKLTEAQAHKYIEKQAMDTRQSRTSVARSILTTYEH